MGSKAIGIGESSAADRYRPGETQACNCITQGDREPGAGFAMMNKKGGGRWQIGTKYERNISKRISASVPWQKNTVFVKSLWRSAVRRKAGLR